MMKKWIKVGLAWGFSMYMMMVFIFPYFGRETISIKSMLLGFVVWVLGGFLFGYAMKKNFES